MTYWLKYKWGVIKSEPLVMLPAVHVICCVVGRRVLGHTDVPFARALKAEIWFIVSSHFQAVLVRFYVYLRYY